YRTTGTLTLSGTLNLTEWGLSSSSLRPPNQSDAPELVLRTMYLVSEAILNKARREKTLMGRFLPRLFVAAAELLLFFAYFVPVVFLAMRSFDGRPKHFFVMPIEIASWLLLAVYGFRAFIYIAGWPEAVTYVRVTV